MKTQLLVVLGLCSIAGMAQHQQQQTSKAVSREALVEQDAGNEHNAIPFRKSPNNNSVNSSISVIDIGNAGNAYTCGFGGKTYLWYEPGINSLTFSHRADPAVTPSAPGSGYILFDMSQDGGVTWSNNLGNLYDPTLHSPLSNNARYPQSAIYNPSGNTDPGNAYLVYCVPTLTTTNGGSWGGIGYGVQSLDTTQTATQHEDSTAAPYYHGIPDGFHAVANGGPLFSIAHSSDFSNTTNPYTGNLNLLKFTFNTGTSDVDLTRSSLPHTVSVGLDTANILPVETKIAFAPNGTTGWISIIGHTSFTLESDSAYYLTFYKTTDGGATWGSAIDVPISTLPNIDDSLGTGLTKFTTAFEHDIAVDKNGNPHVFVAVGGSNNSWSILNGPGFWGLFDITTNDGGTTWMANLVAKPQTFRGNFGQGSNAIAEDSRPHIATTADGSKLFYVWFDTDTLTFGSGVENLFPDVNMRGYDIDNDLWTAPRPHPVYGTPSYNFTAGSSADGSVTFGNVSYYVIESAGTYCVPVSYQYVPDIADLLAPTQMKYIDGLCFSDSDFTNSIEDKQNNVFALGNSYPNPFTENTTLPLELMQSTKVSLSITNMMGQVVRVQEIGKLPAGSHGINVSRGELTNGIYFCNIQAGGFVVTRKLVVQ
ncbi:MAG: T9SS type A sorting domain-containing protein [Flavobacteriales bacterium]|nr:T9SS type A sorting domain-containing protein [Flavobacteriales bacterium]